MHTASLRLVLAAMVLGCVVGCGTSDKKGPTGSTSGGGGGAKRIVFLINTPDPFWDALNAGLIEGAKQYEMEKAGYTVSRDSNDGTPEGQIDKLRQYATQPDIAAVAISVIQADNEAIVEEMRNLQKKGIKVITVDGDVNRDQFRDARPYYIGTDNIVAGRVLGQATKALLESRSVKSGTYVQFVGYTDNDNARNRMNGFQEAVGDAFKEADRMPDQTDRAKARDNVRNALTNHKDLVALIGIWAYNAPAIAEVVEERGVRDKITVATFDAQAQAIEHMQQGMIDVMVVQNPFDMGVQTVRLLKAMLQNDEAIVKEMFPSQGEPDGDIYTTGLRVVVPDSKSPVKAELFDSNVVEHMELPAFQEWLKKYNLTDS